MEKEISTVYFIGIGGIGVSALARHYLALGLKVYGSDLAASEITESLKKAGAVLSAGPANLKTIKPQLLIYSPAVPDSDAKLAEARRLGIKCLSYPEALGEISKKYFTVAVCGTHGKSTTTAMLAMVMISAGLDPTVVVGTKLKEFGGANYRAGKSQYLLIEACEHMESFLNYWPQVIIVTNIEADHLDYYKNEDNYRHAFEEFAGHLGADGILVADGGEKNSADLMERVRGRGIKVVDSRLGEAKEGAVGSALKVPGAHNVRNALAALAAVKSLGIGEATALKAIGEYRGAWRRFEIEDVVIAKKCVVLVSDYGHHPTEVRATLEAARSKWPDRSITAVFQPHQYERTFYLFDEFAAVFNRAPVNRLVLTDIYGVAGREGEGIGAKVSSEKLAAAADKESVFYVAKKSLSNWIENNIQDGEILMMIGAGDIYELSEALIKKHG